MTDPRAAPAPRPAAGILVTGAGGAVGQAVVDALVARGESVVAGVRDPRALIADGAKWASGTAAAQATAARGAEPRGAETLGASARNRTSRYPAGNPVARTPAAAPARPNARPTGKPARAPNQKPDHNPAHKPVTPAAGSSAGRVLGKPSAAAVGAASADGTGAVVRAFDFADRSTWAAALARVDRVVLIPPRGVADVGRFVIPFIDTAMESGVRQLVVVSQLGLPFDTRTPQRVVEHYLKRTHAPYTVLRPNVVLQMLTTVCRDDIRNRHEIVLPAGTVRMALVDARDVAAVAAKVLTERGHLRKTYTVSGERALGYQAVAGILSEVLGRPISYTAPSEADYLALLAKQGVKPDVAAALRAVFRVVRGRGAMLPNRTVRRLTGHPAISVRQFVDDHRDVWL